MLQRIISIILLATVLLSACAPAATPVPVKPTTVPVELTAVPVVEPTPEPKPIKLTWWTEHAKWCRTEYTDLVTGEITTLAEPEEPGDYANWLVEQFKKLYPQYADIEIEPILGTYEGGAVGPEFDALAKAGEMPDIIDMFAGRLSPVVEEVGIDVSDYLTDEQLADLIRYDGGELKLIPWFGGMSFKGLNVTLAERACASAPELSCNIPHEDWTVIMYEDLLTIAEAIKRLDEDNWLVCWWGLDRSGQHNQWLWFANVGLGMFKDGKYQGFNTEEGLFMMEEILRFYNEGYFTPGAPSMNDDTCIEIAAREGRELITSVWPDSTEMEEHGYWGVGATAYLAGDREELGVGVPLLGVQVLDDVQPLPMGTPIYNGGGVTIHTPEHARQAAVDFTWFIAHMLNFEKMVNITPAFHSQAERGFTWDVYGPYVEYVAQHGQADQGMASPCYNDIRNLFSETMTAMFLGVLTPQGALDALDTGAAELCE